jgi:hypothetical protein
LPLERRDTGRYLCHRMEVAGSNRSRVFTWRAQRMIHRYAQGLPRRINAIAERSLLIAFLKGRAEITGRTVAQARRELQGNSGESVQRRRAIVPATIAAAFAAVVVITWPSVFPDLADYITPPIVATDHEVPLADDGEEIIPVSAEQYVISDYVGALEILATLEDGLAGPGILNLHPEPGSLKYITRPSIASVENGYVVLVHATDDYVRVLGRERAFVEIPMEEFRSLYRWNTILTHGAGQDGIYYARGDSGYEVQRIQRILAEMGYSTQKDGVYDITTAEAVERLQEDFGLRRDGVAGEETLTLFDIIEKGT